MVAPRGFCAGVRRAIQAVEDALERHGAPVFVRRPIVHNLEVVRSLEAKGAVFVEELEEAPFGATMIFSAHGVTPQVEADAEGRGMRRYDATCPLVAKVHREVERHQRNGRTVILIGHNGHPEIEGTLGRLRRDAVHLISDVQDVARLPVRRDHPIAYAIQTTYSVSDAADIVAALKQSFLDVQEPPSSDICYATSNRQAAIREAARHADAVIVVGEDFSSNARRLAEVASAECDRTQLAAGPGQLDWSIVPQSGLVAITAAASTPESSVQAIVQALGTRFQLQFVEEQASTESITFKPVPIG